MMQVEAWGAGSQEEPEEEEVEEGPGHHDSGVAEAAARAKKRKKAEKAAKHIQFLQNGCTLTKVRGKGKTYERFFRLDDECLSVNYTNSSKVQCWHDLVGSSRDQSKVYLGEIIELREGPLSDTFVKAFNDLGVSEEQCFTLVIGDKHKTLDLVAEDSQSCKAWVKGLKHLLKKLSEADLATQQDIWLREMFRQADKNGDEFLNLKEVLALLKFLNFAVDFDTAKIVFKDLLREIRSSEADTNKQTNKKGEDVLDMDEFVAFYQLLTRRQEVEDIFEKYNQEGSYLDAKELQEFMKKEQFQSLSIDQCKQLIHKHEACPKVKSTDMMSIEGFYSLLASEDMDILNPNHRQIYMDMTQPLSHYFIDSSHNTYLTADQLVGPSSVEAYIRALKMGCRCVELDCWDGDKGDPVIYHGYTLTSKILFKDAVYAINAYAFEASEYPVILSIENHCSVEQQRLMASYMKETFAERLLTEPLPDDATCLPSPESLKGRIIVKWKAKDAKDVKNVKRQAKKLPPIDMGDGGDEDEGGYVSDEDEAADIDVEAVVDDQIKEELSHIEKHEKKAKLAKELSECVIICQSVHFKGFEHAKEHYNFKQMSSYAEGKAMSLVENEAEAWVNHNKRQISRIYPGGLRTDSSNYDPMPMWLAGNQIVALNYQTPDDYMHVNGGLFVNNGSCGYILKPSYMRSDEDFDPMGPYPTHWMRKLRITIISGYQLPKKKGDKTKSILDPYVKVDVIGVPADNRTEKTNYVKNNGFHPEWNETFEFNVSVPDLALVRFRVMDYESRSSNVLVAQYCLPFNSLMRGYRQVNLKNKYGEQRWGASLFVRVDIT